MKKFLNPLGCRNVLLKTTREEESNSLFTLPGGCLAFPLNGECRHRFRDQLPSQIHPLDFPHDLWELKLKLKIGDKIYPLGDITDEG